MSTMADIEMTPGSEAVSKISVGALYAADVASAVSASFLVSPLITIAEKSIMQNASGAMKMGDSVRAGLKELVLRPHVFLRRPEFAMVWGVYTCTYSAANLIITTCERQDTDAQWPKFLGTTAVNMATCITKDRAFARMFSTTPPHKLPIPSYLFFFVRDATTVAASFNLPTPMSTHLQDQFGLSKDTADITAQIGCPAAMQLISTPLHLLGLDYYNHPDSSIPTRAKFIGTTFGSTIVARMCRIGPAFGIGGVGNTALRKHFRGSFAGC